MSTLRSRLAHWWRQRKCPHADTSMDGVFVVDGLTVAIERCKRCDTLVVCCP